MVHYSTLRRIFPPGQAHTGETEKLQHKGRSAMKFEHSLENDIVVFGLSGKIMGGEETTMFHGKIHEYLGLNKKNFVLDLSRVDWMNSVGLGMLISALTAVKNAGGRLVLANITKIESILTITRLITVFEHFDSRDDALKAFG
jgi:anti-sigma B factor antagonist